MFLLAALDTEKSVTQPTVLLGISITTINVNQIKAVPGQGGSSLIQAVRSFEFVCSLSTASHLKQRHQNNLDLDPREYPATYEEAGNLYWKCTRLSQIWLEKLVEDRQSQALDVLVKWMYGDLSHYLARQIIASNDPLTVMFQKVNFMYDILQRHDDIDIMHMFYYGDGWCNHFFVGYLESFYEFFNEITDEEDLFNFIETEINFLPPLYVFQIICLKISSRDYNKPAIYAPNPLVIHSELNHILEAIHRRDELPCSTMHILAFKYFLGHRFIRARQNTLDSYVRKCLDSFDQSIKVQLLTGEEHHLEEINVFVKYVKDSIDEYKLEKHLSVNDVIGFCTSSKLRHNILEKIEEDGKKNDEESSSSYSHPKPYGLDRRKSETATNVLRELISEGLINILPLDKIYYRDTALSQAFDFLTRMASICGYKPPKDANDRLISFYYLTRMVQSCIVAQMDRETKEELAIISSRN